MYFKIFIFFWLLLILTSIINLNNISLIKSLSYLRFGLFFISISYFLDKNPTIHKYLFFSLSSIFIFLFFDSVYQFANNKNLFGMIAIDWPRVSSVFGDEHVMGSFTVRFFPLLIACYFFCFTNNSNIKYFTFLIFIFSVLIILISGERMALFYEFMVICFFLIFIIKKIKLKLYLILTTIIIISVNLYLNQNLRDRLITQTLDEMGLTSNKTYQKEFGVEEPIFSDLYLISPAHQSYFKTALNMFKEKPLIGHGIKSYRILCSYEKYGANVESCTSHPHNTYLQLLSETGILSFVIVFGIFIIIMIKLFLHLFNIKILDDYKLCIICCILITTWPLATTGNFFNNWLSIIYFFPFGFLKNNIVHQNV